MLVAKSNYLVIYKQIESMTIDKLARIPVLHLSSAIVVEVMYHTPAFNQSI